MSTPLGHQRAADQIEAQWFEDDVQPHVPRLRAYLHWKFPLLGEVEDIIQESYLRLLQARTTGKLRSAQGFLFRTARNAALDLVRHRQVVTMEPLTEEAAASVSSDGNSADEIASRNQELEILADAVRHLPNRCREVLTLRRMHGLSHKEIAMRLGISEHTVEKQVGIGLRKCVEYFARHGVINGDNPRAREQR